jgi:hypothetical protein
MTRQDANSEKTLASASHIAKSLPQIAAAVVTLSGLAYFIGWREASAYYLTLGAPWAASGLTASMLLQSSSGLVVLIGISAFLAICLLAEGHATARGLGWTCAGALMVAALLFLPAAIKVSWASSQVSYGLATAAAFLFAVAAGLTLAELVARYRDSSFRTSHLWLIYWVVCYGILNAPSFLGQAKAAYRLDPTCTALPPVSVPGAIPTANWRLVYIADGKALLIWPAKEREKALFRVVEVKEILSIATVATPAR